MPRARTAAVVPPLFKTPPPSDPRWQYTQGPEFIAWTEEHLRIPRGEGRSAPLKWLPWQKEWWNECLRCDEERTWYYRLAVLGVPKKNGKSGMVAGMSAWHVFGDEDEPDPWVAVGSNSDRQADIVFGDLKTMAELNPTMKAAANLFRWEIRLKDVQSGHPHAERVAASKGKLDGKDLSEVGFDELHEAEQETWRILSNGISGRRRAMVLAATTAGFDLDSVLGRIYLKCQSQSTGELPADRTLMWWYGAPEGADHRDPKVWRGANPSLGLAVSEETIAHELTKNSESEFRRYFLNQWTRTENIWVGGEVLDAADVEPFELVPGAPTWVSWDAATKYDSTMVMAGQWFDWGPSERNPQGLPVFGVECWHWERPVDMNGDLVPEWTLPMGEVRELVESLPRRFDVKGIAFDPAFITWEAQELQNAGLPMVEWPQFDSRMVPATQALYQVLTQERFAFHQPVIRRHIENSAVVGTRRGERLVKSKDRKANEGAVCSLMVVSLAMKQEEDEGGFVVYVAPPEADESKEKRGKEESEAD